MTAKLEKIRIVDWPGEPAILLEWSSHKWPSLRQHAMTISHPHGPDQVADALRQLALMVHDDPVLRGKQCPCGGAIDDAEPNCNICGGKP